MRVFKTKNFNKFMKRERIADRQLCEVVIAIENGLIDANLGGGVLKQRIAAKGRGKQGGYRSVVAFSFGDRTVFMYGYAKNTTKKSTIEISSAELSAFKDMARIYFTLDLDKVRSDSSAISEIICHE